MIRWALGAGRVRGVDGCVGWRCGVDGGRVTGGDCPASSLLCLASPQQAQPLPTPYKSGYVGECKR